MNRIALLLIAGIARLGSRSNLREVDSGMVLVSVDNVILEAEGKYPSLMLITIVMPGGNGLDLCRSIRENHALADLVIDSLAMKLSVRGSEVPTTGLEFRLIEYLARHRGQVFARDLLLDAVWGDMQFVTPRSVDACIRRIREKIEPDRTSSTYLKTIRGVGYRLAALAA